MATPKLPRVPESAEQQHIVQLARSLGGRVYVLGTKRKRTDFQGTCQTPGVADLVVFLPRRSPREGWQFLFIECKGRGGRLRPEQVMFQELCRWAEVEHLVGGFNAFIAWLAARNYVKAENFPHYRQPQGEQR